MPLEWRESSL